MKKDKLYLRERRHIRGRKKIAGTAERPRLSVYKSLNHIYAQLINDDEGKTLVFISTLNTEVKAEKGHKGNIDSAKKVGSLVAKKALDKGIKQVVFDKGGFKYHGRIKALADTAREGGLDF